MVSQKEDFALCIQEGTLQKLTWLDGALTVTSIYAGLDPVARMQYVGNRRPYLYDQRVFYRLFQGGFTSGFKRLPNPLKPLKPGCLPAI